MLTPQEMTKEDWISAEIENFTQRYKSLESMARMILIRKMVDEKNNENELSSWRSLTKKKV